MEKELKEKWNNSQESKYYAPRINKIVTDFFFYLRKEEFEELVREVENKKKIGIEIIDECFTCKECGGYDECQCEGYNEALQEVIELLESKIK